MAGSGEEMNELLENVYRSQSSVADELSLLKEIFEGRLTQSDPAKASSDELSAGSVNSTEGDLLGAVPSIARTLLGGIPLVSGLISLFGGSDDSNAVPPVTRYLLPSALQVNAGLFRGGQDVELIDYSQDGTARMSGRPPLTSEVTAAPSVVIQVQALDSQSFLDRSDDIADAVRKALLNLHPLSDVLGQG